jgi:UDP-glucose 4-epimerase
MRVLVTGSSGCLAAALLPALCADPAIERVTGIDIRPAYFAHPKFQGVQVDITTRLQASALGGHDALVHLAYVVLRGRMPEEAMRRINVDASARMLRLAADCAVHRLIMLSSAAVYGSGIDINEGAPLAPLAGFSYGQHKAELERRVASELPHCLRLRPHVILGNHAQPLLRFLLRQPCYPRIAGPEPQLQCVHEDDVVAAVRLALNSRIAGAMNLATAQTFSFAQVIRRLHRFTLPLPIGIGQFLLSGCWRLTGLGGEPGWMQGLCQSLTLDSGRARRELGWVPRYSACEAVSAALV